jgi:hypothetical protein
LSFSRMMSLLRGILSAPSKRWPGNAGNENPQCRN